MNNINLAYDLVPPQDWKEKCYEHASFFNSQAWHDVLKKGFSARTVYIWEQGSALRFTLNIFTTGPFRIGYMNFPIGGTLEDKLTIQHIQALQRTSLPVDLLRIPVSCVDESIKIDLPAVELPESVIFDLPKWCPDALPKLRRDLNKARRSALTLRDLTTHDAALPLYELYRKTVLSHGGSLRYTEAYFDALLKLTQSNSQIRCIAAYSEETLCGFVVVVLDGKTGYYLHGASDNKWKHLGVSDLLVSTSIEWAKENDKLYFNLMTSPKSQPGLIRYKEKFGAMTGKNLNYEITFSPLRALMFRIAYWLYSRLRHVLPTGN